MKRLLALGLALLALPAFAARPTSEGVLFVRLNGVPVRLGVITATSGTSTTNASTSSAFTIAGGSVLKVTCDLAAVVTIGGTASTSYTNANFGAVMSAGVAQYFVLRDSDTTIAVAAGATVNCAVHNML